MNETIELTCPRCQHKWQQSLQDLEKPEIIYKSIETHPKLRVEKYRARCPNDGTYVIFEVTGE